MKNLKIVLFSVFAMGTVLTSCSKDDDGGGENIEGRWEYFQDGTLREGEEFMYEYEHGKDCSKDFVEFLAKGAFREVNFEGDKCEQLVYNEKWERKGDVISVSNLGHSPDLYTIISLTSTELKVKSQVYDDTPIEKLAYVVVYKRVK